MAHSPVIRETRRKELAFEQLSSQEVTYVESRLCGNTPLTSARLAGLPQPNEACTRLEKDERVRAALESAIRLQTYEKRLTRDDVLAGFMDAVGMASTATELVSAWREIGKVIGAYEPQQIEVNAKSREQLRELSDAELANLAAIDADYELVEFDDEKGQHDGGSADAEH